METNNKGFLLCPKCRGKTKTKVIPDTTQLKQFPLFCPWCREEIIIDYNDSGSHSAGADTHVRV